MCISVFLPPQMTSYQNAPEAPQFQGANALISMLSNPNLFRDLSGLDGNQANALQALLSAAQSAQGFTNSVVNVANTAAGLNSQKMNERTRRVTCTAIHFLDKHLKGQHYYKFKGIEQGKIFRKMLFEIFFYNF